MLMIVGSSVRQTLAPKPIRFEIRFREAVLADDRELSESFRYLLVTSAVDIPVMSVVEVRLGHRGGCASSRL